MEYCFYGWEQALVPAVDKSYPGIETPRDLYEALSFIWCAATCAPRMRQNWTSENKTLGQCSITAFLAQDIFGGEVYGILRPDGNYHCYNVVGDCVFDLTSEQFGDEVLSYEKNTEQSREIHFAKEEKRLRYEYLKEKLRQFRKEKTAVLFPGIGYTCEKPLLYYSGKIAARCGYRVITVPYGNFPSGIKGNKEKMEAAFYSALEQAERMLDDTDFCGREVLFISKSVGTIVSAAYAKNHHLSVRSISFTPLEQTFLFAEGEGIMFHGTSDPWAADSDRIREACKKIQQPLYEIGNADHSLETGDVETDICNLQKIMRQVLAYICAK